MTETGDRPLVETHGEEHRMGFGEEQGQDGVAVEQNGKKELPELSADEILALDDIIEETLEVPEWGTIIRVRGLTGRERDAYEASLLDERGKKTRTNWHNARAKLVVLSTYNVDHTRKFSESQIPALAAKSSKALDRVFTKARELSGMTEEDLEELTLGLDDAQSEPSTTG